MGRSLVAVRAGGSRVREPRLAIGGTGAETYAGTGVLAVELAGMAVVIGNAPRCRRGSRNRPIKSSKDRGLQAVNFRQDDSATIHHAAFAEVEGIGLFFRDGGLIQSTSHSSQ